MATGTEVVRTHHRHGSNDGKDGLGALFLVLSLLAARARKGPQRLRRRRKLKDLCQCRRPRLMHGCADCGLGRLQVESAFLTPALKQNLKDAVYFALDFVMDRFRRFFSWAVNVSSTDRVLQIFSFTSRSS